jgi:hypothetical protein
MTKELYFDIVSDEWAGGLYRIVSESGKLSFYYHHSLSDLEDDEHHKTRITETDYNDFASFWKTFILTPRWFTLHPLYIHPDQRPFIKEELRKVSWNTVADEKWREMYQRQWNKVLSSPAEYYKPLQP